MKPSRIWAGMSVGQCRRLQNPGICANMRWYRICRSCIGGRARRRKFLQPGMDDQRSGGTKAAAGRGLAWPMRTQHSRPARLGREGWPPGRTRRHRFARPIVRPFLSGTGRASTPARTHRTRSVSLSSIARRPHEVTREELRVREDDRPMTRTAPLVHGLQWHPAPWAQQQICLAEIGRSDDVMPRAGRSGQLNGQPSRSPLPSARLSGAAEPRHPNCLFLWPLFCYRIGAISHKRPCVVIKSEQSSCLRHY